MLFLLEAVFKISPKKLWRLNLVLKSLKKLAWRNARGKPFPDNFSSSIV